VSCSPVKYIVLTTAILFGVAAFLQCVVTCTVVGSADKNPTMPPTDISTLSDEYGSNATLVVDGTTTIYENVRIIQAGNIMIVNGGKLVLRNTTLVLLQLCTQQYTITLTGTSEMLLQGSIIDSKYPVTVLMADSILMLNESLADHVAVVAHGVSNIAATSSSLKSVDLCDTSRLIFESGSIYSTSVSGRSSVIFSYAELSCCRALDMSSIAVYSSDIEALILSGSANVTCIESVLDELHLWDWSSVCLSGAVIGSFELYDSSRSAVSSSNFTDIVVRSSSHQEFASLGIGRLTCGGGSSTVLRFCSVGSAEVWIADLDVYGTSLSKLSYGYMTHGLVNCSSIESLESSFGAVLWVLNCTVTSTTCSRNSVTRLESSRIGQVDAWDFDGGNLTVEDSQIGTMWVRWDTILDMSGSVVSRYLMWDRAQAKLVSSNFTSELGIGGDTKAFVFDASIERLYLYNNANVSFVRCNLTFGFSYANCIRILSDLPLGPVRFWNPTANGSIVGESYTAEFVDCIVLGYAGVCKYDVDITIVRSQIDFIALGNRVRLLSNESSFGEVQASNGDTSFHELTILSRCNVTSLSCSGPSKGILVQCNVSSWNCVGTWSAKDSVFGYVSSGSDGFVDLLNCTVENMLWNTGRGTMYLANCTHVHEIRQYDTSFIFIDSSFVETFWCGAPRSGPSCTLVNSTIHVFGANSDCTVTFACSRIDYLYTNEHSIVNLQDCGVGEFVAAVSSHVTITNQFSRDPGSYYSVRDAAVVERLFRISILYPNSTPAGFTFYRVLAQSGGLLWSGTASSDGTSGFVLIFSSANSQTFDDSFELRVESTGWKGSAWFSVTSSQPVILVLEEAESDGLLLYATKSDGLNNALLSRNEFHLALTMTPLLGALGLAVQIGKRWQG